MLWVVVVSNGFIGLLCLLTAWRLWQLKQRLAKAADKLLMFERSVHRLLNQAPDTISKGHSGLHQLRTNYQRLERQWQRVQQALALLSLGQSLWQSQFVRVQRPRSPRPATATRRSS